VRDILKRFARRLPRPFHHAARKTDEFARGMTMGGTLFEELGFYYVGPIDGHNLDHLIPVLENVRDAEEGPVLVHVVTKKGKGYAPAEAAPDKYHGVQKFDVITGAQAKAPPGPPQYQNVFGDQLVAGRASAIRRSSRSPRRCRRAPASIASPKRFRIARSMWASPNSMRLPLPPGSRRKGCGRSARSIRPSCSAPTTRWCMTWRSRICRCASRSIAPGWSAPMARHMPASFDVTYLATLPNFVVMAAADEAELVHMTHTAALHDSGPIAVRYPRGAGVGVDLPQVPERLEIGKGRVVREGKTVAILSLGTRLEEALKAADTLEAKGLSTTVADLRFAKPLDEALIRRLLTAHEVAVTIEENAVGGFGAHVLTLASDEGLIDGGLKLRTMRLPDTFQDQDKPEKQYAEAGLDADHIVSTVLTALRHNSTGVHEGARA
jgi:1-deoxy-D-xylulose-5-phosphate synthase